MMMPDQRHTLKVSQLFNPEHPFNQGLGWAVITAEYLRRELRAKVPWGGRLTSEPTFSVQPTAHPDMAYFIATAEAD